MKRSLSIVFVTVALASWPVYFVLAGGRSGVYTAPWDSALVGALFAPVLVVPILWPQENPVLLLWFSKAIGSELWALILLISLTNALGYTLCTWLGMTLWRIRKREATKESPGS